MNQSVFRLDDVRQCVRLSKSQIYSLISRGDFPKPFKLSERASAWDPQEIHDWIESRKAAA